MKIIGLWHLFAVALALQPACARAAQPSATPLDLRTKLVAILPVQDKSGREGQERAQFVEAATDALRNGFQKGGLSVIGSDEVSKAAQQLRIDLQDPDQRTPDHLTKLAGQLGARFIASAAVLDVDSHLQQGWFISRKKGAATVELAVYDAQVGRFTIRDTYHAVKKSSGWFPALSKSSTKRTGAIEAAVTRGIKEFLGRVDAEASRTVQR